MTASARPTSRNGVRPRAPTVAADPLKAPDVLPHNLDAERAVLGGILLRNATLREPELRLEHEDFYDPRHRLVWSAISELEEERVPLDELTLKAQLERTGKLKEAGGLAYIGQLALRVPTTDNVIRYAGRRRSRCREAAHGARLQRAGCPRSRA